MADAIAVDNPRARDAHEMFEFLRASRREASDRGTRGFLLVAPSQTGKSKILSTYQSRVNTTEALQEGRIPVLMVTLTANQTRKGLAQDILRAFEPFGYLAPWQKGTEAILLDRVAKYIEARRVELLILDEFHHLVHSDRQEVNVGVSETVKWLLIQAVAPVVMAGISDAWEPLRANTQLARRCEPPMELAPLDLDDPKDKSLYSEFLAAYLVQLESRGIAQNATGLLTLERVPDCIFEVSKGVLGETCNLIKAALYLAVRAGRDEIAYEDLEQATQLNYVAMKPTTPNPFKVGLSSISPAHRAAAP